MLRHRNTLRLPKRQAGHLFIGARRALLGGPKWTPLPLYTAGEQGVWYDPSDLTTLFADSAGTTPAVVGGPVGLMLDKSGRGNHASQPTAINRPVLQQDGAGLYYLAFNGTNSWMSTASINFTATDKMTVVAGLRKLSDSPAGMALELSTNDANIGIFNLYAELNASVGRWVSALHGAIGKAFAFISGVTAPVTSLVTLQIDYAGTTPAQQTSARLNGVAFSPGTSGSAGTGTFGNYPIFIGSRAGYGMFFNGLLYSLVIRGALSSNSQIAAAERFVNAKTGAF